MGKNSATGNRTPVSRVTGGDTSHYTIAECPVDRSHRDSNPEDLTCSSGIGLCKGDDNMIFSASLMSPLFISTHYYYDKTISQHLKQD
eukprot:scaffold1103_cov187-Alexandrium_tamarense.AAC.4